MKTLEKYLKEESKNKLKFFKLSSADNNNYRSFIFKDENGREIIPAKLNTSLPLNVFKALEKMLKKELE